MILGMLSVFGIFMLTRGQFWRLAATIAALMLALSPVFITYSSLVMSDVPTLFVTICAAVMLVVATSDYVTQSSSWMRMAAWLMFGLLAGFSTIIRPTNAAILVGFALCVLMVPLERRDLASLAKVALAVAIGFAIPVAWQLHQNSINLGSAFASGYSWWVPEVYGAGGRTFSAAYLFGPTMPRNPHGNVIVYLTTLLGLDGMLGDRGNPRYFLYPFAAAVFAIVGFIAIFRAPGRSNARRLMWFGLGYLAALTGALLLLRVHRRGLHPSRRVHPVHRGGLRSGGGQSIHAPGIQEPESKDLPARFRGQRDRTRPAAGNLAGFGSRRSSQRAARVLCRWSTRCNRSIRRCPPTRP